MSFDLQYYVQMICLRGTKVIEMKPNLPPWFLHPLRILKASVDTIMCWIWYAEPTVFWTFVSFYYFKCLICLFKYAKFRNLAPFRNKIAKCLYGLSITYTGREPIIAKLERQVWAHRNFWANYWRRQLW
jgi:hypothetical protein